MCIKTVLGGKSLPSGKCLLSGKYLLGGNTFCFWFLLNLVFSPRFPKNLHLLDIKHIKTIVSGKTVVNGKYLPCSKTLHGQ